MRMFIKICGITRLADALHAAEQGATALGFVFWPRSPRAVTPEQAAGIVRHLPRDVATVGVFVDESIEAIRQAVERSGVAAVQLHGDEPASYGGALGCPVLRSVTLESAAGICAAWPADVTLLLDAADRQRRGGTGAQVDWPGAATLARRRRVVLAGGLTPGNVAEAIATVHPFGVDVSSGVEAAPGIKDRRKVAEFLEHARGAFGAS